MRRSWLLLLVLLSAGCATPAQSGPGFSRTTTDFALDYRPQLFVGLIF